MWQPSLISRADSSRAVALGREQHWDQSGDLLNTPGGRRLGLLIQCFRDGGQEFACTAGSWGGPLVFEEPQE